ncbi:hypothetical protein [Agathobaculum sp. Marseille-P7918]|uniref:hypothetical protein n=1 Tax=Agathobaculum sp. Marseille-P7918 TaxID=2479843 RepID=UPI0035651320
MSLIEANILCLNGDRQTSPRLTTDNYKMFLNPHLNSFLEFETKDHQIIPLNQLKIRIKDPEILKRLLSWDGIRAACYYAMKQNNDQPAEEVADWWCQKELSELNMQLDNILLDSSHGMKARILHKIENQKKRTQFVLSRHKKTPETLDIARISGVDFFTPTRSCQKFSKQIYL